MSVEKKFEDLTSRLHKLFSQTYFAHAELENEDITEEDKETLKSLDYKEVVENLKELIQVLLNDKSQLMASDVGELQTENRQFESMIQKLEQEVRSHIRAEEQLKIHIEEAQQRVDELERNPTAAKKPKDLSEFEDKISTLTSEIDQIEKRNQQLNSKAKAQDEKIESQETKIKNLEKELHAVKSTLFEKITECKNMKSIIEQKTSRTPQPPKESAPRTRNGTANKSTHHSRRIRSFELKEENFVEMLKKKTRGQNDSWYGKKDLTAISMTKTKPGHFRAKTSIRFYKC